jgi:hypothetical protein
MTERKSESNDLRITTKITINILSDIKKNEHDKERNGGSKTDCIRLTSKFRKCYIRN